MTLPDALRKHGFRRWYERELLSSHAHLLLLFLCSIGLLATFELFSLSAPISDQLADAAALILLIAVGLRSLRRYLYLLMHAEQVANQAVCLKCESYGWFSLIDENHQRNEIRVRCKKCQHEWPISH